MAAKIVLALVLSLLVYAVSGETNPTAPCIGSAQQCRLQRLRTVEPTRRWESEGGRTELWEESEEEFQCAGVAAIRHTVQPNSLSLPNFNPAPMLVYIEQGEGLMGLTYPGCAETYESETSQELSRRRSSQMAQLQGERSRRSDQHQKIHRIRRGDILAIPAGAAHWSYNDGNEELVAFAVMDLNNHANQLDRRFRLFFLAGGEPRQEHMEGDRERTRQRRSRQQRVGFQSLFSGFSEELLAEAYNIPVNIARRLQEDDSQRGIIVRCQEEMRRMIRPDEDRQEGQRWLNGLEETVCTTRIRHNLDTQSESDFVSRQGGRVNIVNMHKLPILRFMDMSAEKGHLFPNAMYTPHWSMTDNRVVYVLRGEARVQIVDDNGNNVFDERVKRGDVFVIPQFFAVTSKAGNDGFEYVTIKTSGQPMKSPMAGYTSVIKAMPIDVLANAYQMSLRDAQNLKNSRGHQSFLLSSSRSAS
ncbi:11S globulin seed storage protein 2-like [Juglans microcarpa x Juglans regia]|uniref:11S globulin seed storage protein 2-like n=1 Tax=Juglans microcarpa x Juglans regia TaxID=2249226 RepID=UPI001B7DBE25|nr:11S globulin seed storage protein 2-like [Juglans microcarpa x Juglans regia]